MSPSTDKQTRPGPESLARGEEVSALISDLTEQILAGIPGTEDLVVAGITNGGITLGRMITRLLEKQTGASIPYGVLETSFHRDDIGSRPIPPVSNPTDIPVSIEGKSVLLVDDVIASGRTVRAAINELFDQGRPESIRLAVLLDRGGRKLPVQPDFLAITRELPSDRLVKVHIDEENPHGHEIQSLPV